MAARGVVHRAGLLLPSGGKLALSTLIGGVTAVVYFSALHDYPPEVGAAYSVALTITTAIATLGSGLTVFVLHSSRRGGDTAALTPDFARASLSATLGLTALLILAGIVISLPGSPPFAAVAYWSRVPATVMTPIGAVVTGLLLCAGKEGRVLRAAVENLVLSLLAAAAIGSTDVSPHHVLLLVGGISLLVNAFTVLRQWLRLGELGAPLARAFATALRRPRATVAQFRRVPSLVAGASDGLVMMGTFAVITITAAQVSAQIAALTGLLATVVRSIVIPLKQFGLSGGRLTSAGAADDPGRLRGFTGVVFLLVAPVGLALLVAPHAVLGLLGVSSDAGDLLLAARLCGAQLLIEPVASFLSGSLKVLVGPATGFWPLLGVMAVFVIPATLIAAVTGHLSATLIWAVLLVGRLGYSGWIVSVWKRWASTTRTPLHAA